MTEIQNLWMQFISCDLWTSAVPNANYLDQILLPKSDSTSYKAYNPLMS